LTYQGLGDVVGTPAQNYWELRAYSQAQARSGAKLVNIRRASDNATIDVKATLAGGLDLPTALKFCAGTSCLDTQLPQGTVPQTERVITVTGSTTNKWQARCDGTNWKWPDGTTVSG
jgi:hypothetical protein